MKMYILVNENIPVGNAITSVAHASLIAHLKWKDDIEYNEWLNTSFKKVICKLNDIEFNKAKEDIDYEIVTESYMDNKETVLVFKPRKDYSKAFKYYRLYK